MDDFGNSSGGFSSCDAAGCSSDAGGCSAFSNSDTGGISPSCGGFIDSSPYSVDTFPALEITSNCNCDVALGVNDHDQCGDLTGNNAYYYAACFQNNMEHGNISAHPNDIQLDLSQSTYPIPVMLSAPIPAMPSAPYFVDGYLNKDTQSTWNDTEDKELMLLRSEIAQLQIMLASSKTDEKKNAAIRAKILDLTARMEPKGNMRGQYNVGLRNYQNHVTTVTKHKKSAALYLRPNYAGVDMQNIRKARRKCCIAFIIFAVITATIFAVVIGVTFTVGKK
ncbi:hypothetical protein ACJMK2_021206 [Sinanodonta woodiana]|uniref:Uncharacterized protein n=1 Tax=Sinanodonta woodiana TaxID=1069815 RepID=A0ABD3U1D5_SINWO